MNSEETYSVKTKKNTRSEQRNDYQNGSQPNLRAYDINFQQILEYLQGSVQIRTETFSKLQIRGVFFS